MEFYFDIEFLKGLNSAPLSEETKVDFKKFIKSINDSRCFVFNSGNLSRSDLEFIPFYDLLTDIVTVKHISHSTLIEILDDETTTGFKFFFLDHCGSIDEIKNDYGFFCLNSISINDEWPKFESGRQDLRRSVSETKSEKTITQWSDLEIFFQFPINSVVISDRYAFKDDKAADINILKLIRTLNLKPLSKRKVDVVIISDTFKKLSNLQNEQNNLKFDKIFSTTLEIFNSILGKDHYNLSFLMCDGQTDPNSENIHSRILWTNVLLLNPGDSFTFFKEDNRSKSLTTKRFEYLNIDFFLWSRARHREHINILKKALSTIENGVQVGTEPALQRVKIHGKRTCRLLV